MTRINKILCTVDFSNYSAGGLHCAVGISEKLDAKLYVYHSIHSPRDPIYGATEFQRGRDLEKKLTEIHNKIEDLMINCAVDWEAVFSVGDPVVESARMCNELGIDLVVAASHGISGFKRVFLGTVVERLARNISRPMIVTHESNIDAGAGLERPFAGFKRIVVGCDFHEDSIPSIKQAVNFAKSFQASLHLLHVMESPVYEEMIDLTEAPYSEVQEKLSAKMLTRLGELLPRSIREGLDVQPEISTGLPAEEIVTCAKRLDADLIVLGVRKHDNFDKIMIGSSTESVLRKAPCTILAVPGVMGDAL
jgi:nucleotide-binding universal stress UspA family protein